MRQGLEVTAFTGLNALSNQPSVGKSAELPGTDRPVRESTDQGGHRLQGLHKLHIKDTKEESR